MGEKIVKGVAFGLILVFLLSVTVGMASALSNLVKSRGFFM